MKKHQYESLGKRCQYPVPPEVHRGYVHPGKPYYTLLSQYFWTVWIL